MNPNSSQSHREVIEALEAAWTTMSSTRYAGELRKITEEDATDLRQALLRFPAYLDDSISNGALGDLHDRSGDDPLNVMADNIAAAYGVKKTFPGATGTTGLNVPAVMTLAGEGQKIGITRDCHISVVGGLYLSGAEPVYLVPPFDPDLGVLLPPSRQEIATLLDAHPDMRAMVLTMPTYHGIMGDIKGIVEECHSRNVLVMIDGAHAPHFHFLRGLGFPSPAEDAGADMVTQSTHKVMPALSQGSVIHINNLNLVARYQEFQAMGFQSTSFSYPILLSIEHAIEQMVKNGEQLWARAVDAAQRLRQSASRLPGVRTLGDPIIDGSRVVGLDPTRVTLNVRGTGLSGYEVRDRLCDRGEIVELATADVVLLLLSPGVTEPELETTLEILRATLGFVEKGAKVPVASRPPPLPDRFLTPRQAMAAPRQRIATQDAVGRVSGETIGCYPPGQAIFVAGEHITKEAIDYLTSVVDAGGHLKRVADDHFETIDVVR